MNLRHFIFVSCLILSISAVCQEPSTSKTKEIESINGLLAFQVGIPSKKTQEAILNEMGNVGFGGGLTILTNPFSWGKNKRNSPLRIGGEVGYTYYGRFISDVNINGYSGDYKTSYGILNLNAIIQIRASQAEKINPFAEFLIGGSFYLSSIRENLDVIESSLGIQPVDMGGYNSASFNKGLAVGLTIGKPEKKSARFTVRVSYNWGSDIKYVVRNSLKYDQGTGTLSYAVGKAPVSYILAQIGIGF